MKYDFCIHFQISIKVISIFNKSTFPLFFVKRKTLAFDSTGRRRKAVDGLNTDKNDVTRSKYNEVNGTDLGYFYIEVNVNDILRY